MTKNLKKAFRLLRSGALISEERFPVNFERAMQIAQEEGLETEVTTEPMTEAEFHQEHSVEKEQV